MINVYVVNLISDLKRKEYMKKLLCPYKRFMVAFVDAVNGKNLSEQEVSDRFDRVLAYQRYGRELERGEIGCTLSHFKCYQNIVKIGQRYALILEDDITILRSLEVLDKLIKYVDIDEPVILFLSGDYWFYRRSRIDEDYSLASVYDAVGSYAYFINKAAAELILQKNKKGACTADNWSLYKNQGVTLKAIYPYVIDANIESFESTINQVYFGEKRENMPWKIRWDAYKLSLGKKILLWSGRFVSKIRKNEE